ncbi:non-ribosomal peptide synthetase, partial [Pyxidicoccus fallax]|uniref:non-ribosomal peptide synthetase n=1 Tax=Pyxidicoccus fallax TaxID=394095 RepID=UPI0020A6605A
MLRAAQAERTPDAVALRDGEQRLSWREAHVHAHALATELRARGVGPGVPVAVCLEPSPVRAVALWGVLASGGAYALVAPEELNGLGALGTDGTAPLLIASTSLSLPPGVRETRVIRLTSSGEVHPARGGDAQGSRMSLAEGLHAASALPASGMATDTRAAAQLPTVEAGTLACLASQGTGNHGARVMLSHRNLVHRFTALDARVEAKSGETWLGASESSDPTDLELLWALSRGLTVVFPAKATTHRVSGAKSTRKPLDFSLFYFANDAEASGRARYQLLIDGAKFADTHGFSAVWTPERHFHAFGGPYPSPTATSAALAMVTERVAIRAGSVVLPLHDSVRVAEEWSVVDNLSNGRAGVSFATGWNVNDFIFAPENFNQRPEAVRRGVEEVRTLWRGGTVRRTNGQGAEVDISIRPRPVQADLPIWLTAAFNPDTFRLAGELGAGLLTNVLGLGQDFEELARKIALYREARRKAGHDRGHVVLMLHTFVAGTQEEVKRQAREPLIRYFRSSVELIQGLASSQGLDVRGLTPQDLDVLLEQGVSRYLEAGGLFGTPETLAARIEQLRQADVDEVACLIDFGLPHEVTLEGLRHLDVLRRDSQPSVSEVEVTEQTLAEQLRASAPQHLRCTATLAQALARMPDAAEVLAPVRTLVLDEVGEEVATALKAATSARVVPAVSVLPEVREVTPSGPRFVLDSVGRRAPVGVVGELFLGGDAVPLGFWNAPELARSRLRSSPEDTGLRLLGTGTHARYRVDGSVEVLTPTARPRPTPGLPASAPRPPARPESQPRADALIPRIPRTDSLPLSFAQQRLWFLDQYQPGTALYNIPSAMRLEGRLDVAALGRAFAELMRRHEALHTTFQAREGNPIQVLAPESVATTLEVDDLGHLPAEQREAEALRLAREEACRPFDLSRGPLLRARLVRLSDTEHLLLVTMHHIVSDGWSIGVLIREVVTLYQAFVAGRPSPLPELPIQYADYAVWQREWLKGPVLEEQLAWWKGQLEGAPPALELLTDRPRTTDTSNPGASYRVQLPLELMQGLRALCRREKGTLFMGLLAGLQALLSRYTGQEDICVGAPIAGRTQPQTEGLIGFFVNTMVLRTHLDGDPSFQELLRRVRDVTLGAYAHQDVPFEKLVEVLQPPRQAGHTPFFQVTLVLLNTPAAELATPGLTFRPVDVDSGTSKFDLTLVCTETPRGLSTVLEYRSDLFEPSTAERLMEHLRALLEDAVAHPERRLSELSLMAEAERRQVLVDWNAAAVDSTSEPCVHELFDAQAARTPDAVAVVFDGSQLTYAELQRRANQLAWHLRATGVRTGDRVALCLERSPEMVVSVLAVLKMGAAFVPVDPQYPAERLAFMLEDSGAPVVLTQSHLVESLPPGSRARVVCVDAEADALARLSDDTPEWPVSPDALCYIIYTSGSTGRPKGIAVPHRTLSNVVAWQRRQSVRAEATTLQFASLNFDVSYQEMFSSWAVGGTLAVPSSRVRQDMPALLDFIVRHDVERVFLPFIALRALVEAVAHATHVPKHLREVVTAGEQLQVTPALVAFFERLPECVLENQYGPSEAHVVSAHRLRGAPSTWPLLPSVGSAVPGTRLYVLDPRGRPCAIGVPGEVFVGGVQVALGYHERPELTAEKFVPDALSGVPGARLYRTGDRARWKADGALEYLGRLDGQVKVRGFRIELGEVEAALRDAPGVREAAAMVREDTPGDKRLVGYVVLQPDTAWDPEALRQTLARRMPEYMLPTALVRLDAMPLMPTGKLVRNLLPAPDVESLRGAAPLVAPRNPLEQALADAFAGVLNLSHVGVTDNFFALGGHSLLATQVVARVRTALGVEVALREMFEAPTVESLARRLEGRVPTRARGTSAPMIVPRQETGDAELSYAQQRLWFLDQFQPDSPLYNMPAALRLEGVLDVTALGRAFAELVRRHEVLRTSFEVRDSRPVQVVSPPPEWTLEVEDLSYLPAPEREQAALELAREEARRPFDLTRGPLLRTRLLRLAERHHLLVVTMHHIISDGWSIGVLTHEMVALYEAAVAGRPSALPSLPIQYADYSAWQRTWLQGEVLEKQLDYWRKQLDGAPPALELATDWPRTADASNPGTWLRVELPLSMTQALTALCKQEGATLFMGLLAGLQALLSRYSGQDDVCVGAPIAGRTQAETEGLIGFFVNTLVMRTHLDGDPTFRELLGRVKDVTLDAYAHQDVPFERLVEVLQPPRQPERTPFFQVALVMLNTPTTELTVPGLSLRLMELDSGTAKFDFTLTLSETPEGLRGALEYRTDLYEDRTAARMVDHLRTLLEDAIAHPERRLSELSLLAEEERRRVLVEWNDTGARPSVAACVHELVAAQAARTPNTVAVIHEEARLSYSELERRANQLAHHLLARGVRLGDRVGLCVERSLELAVGVLGILKTGAAYLPLDPGYPAERLAFMLEDAAVPLVVTQDSVIPVLPARVKARRVLLDVEASAIADQPAHAPVVALSPESACYVIYTSGSTGQPKGVALPHRALSNLLAWQLRQSVKPNATTLQFAALSFDVSFQELFSTWCAGGTLVMPTAAVRRDMPALLDLMARTGVERMFLPFVALQAMADAVAHGARVPQRLREVVTAGEQLQVTPAVVALFERLPGCVLENQYGPSETHVVSAYRLDGVPASWPRLPPIGSPLPDTQLYVLDERGQPCAIGVPGELYLGGVQVAHGYLGRPELTAVKFVPDPFSREPGARLYRTGDRARWKAEGAVEFLGRMDGQVKVRGFRIELGEVEAALRDAKGVRDAAAVVREDTPGDRRLVGYVVLQPDAAWAPDSLRETLKGRLPEYMVPSALVRLEALPLTPSGKLARALLPVPDAESRRGDAPYVAPRNPLEQSLADLFAGVLGVPRVGVTDNFFSLGGHSLLATQLVSRLRSSLKVELPLRELFEAPTVEALARRLERQVPTEPRRAAAPVIAPRAVEAELSFAQQRLWFLDQLQPGTALYNMPAALRLEGRVDVTAMEQAFTEVIRRHQALRTTFRAREGKPLQVIAPASPFVVPVEDLGHLPESQREAEAMKRAREEAGRPFDLAQGPLLRTRLLRLSGEHHLLLLTMHHIVTDGWSISVLIHELAALYEAFVSGRPSPLPPLPIQYADFAAWQRQWLQGEVLEQQLDYWRKQLGDAPPTAELPTDRPRMPDSGSPGASLEVGLPLKLTQALATLCQREGATLYMGLVAGLQALVARYSGQDDVSVAAPIAGRTQAETEGLIGDFVNTLVLRTRLDGAPTFRELLARVKDVTLGAYAHQDVPFEKLVEVLQPPRQPGRTPFFQMSLALLNLPTAKLELPGMKMTPLRVDSGTARFDLALVFEETPRGLSGMVEYRTDLYDASTITRMMRHLGALLDAAVAHPERRLSELSLMTGEERHRVLVEWSTPSAAHALETSVHALFAAQAARTPEAVALSFGGDSLTYEALARWAHQLAHHLWGLGVRPGARVGVCLERSVELVVALLGILETGAAYVPLDPGVPPERASLLLQEAGVVALVTREALADELPAVSTSLVLMDAEADRIASRPDSALGVDVGGEALAYVMFTSGSTGQPKGVCVPHRGVVRLVRDNPFIPFGPEQVFLQLAPVAFDASTLEIWGALLNGARLVLAPSGDLSLEDLGELLRDHGITTLWLTAALFEQMVLHQGEALATVPRVLAGGDVLPVARVREHLARLPEGSVLVNGYGPTENTTFSTTHTLRAGDVVGASVPIGRPISGSTAYVLDGSLQLVPPGVPGELYVGGAGLAWGYLGRPELTAGQFIPHPFAATPGERLYRTGDKARWRADGTLEFLGRTDFQVKLRGYRIEPGEVEAVLRQGPGVREAVVVVREDVPGDKRLVAYVVGPEVDVRALRAFLQQKLPEYMVPSAVAVLEALPLNANGKVDRKVLPAPEAPVSDAEHFVAPRTPVEEQLAALWRELLHVSRVGVHDDFFELGGHSLLATQLLSRIRAVFGGELSLGALFDAPTLGEQAARIEALVPKVAALPASTLRPMPRQERMPLSFAQQRLWFLDRLEPGGSLFNIPIALRIAGAVDVSALERAFREVVRRHESLRTVFLDLPEGPAQVVLSGVEPRLVVEDLRVLPADVREAEALRLQEDEARRPFDLSTGPLLRATLLHVQEAEYLLLLTMHHITSDGWSMGVLVREVVALYAAHVAGLASPLPPLTVQYADYAAWQREWLKGDVLESQLAYWRGQLTGAPAVLELPADRPRPAVRTYRGATHQSLLDPALARKLEALALREGATLFMLLMAGFQSLLHRYSGQTDLVVGTDVANRNRAETEPLIGFFINQLALRLRLEGNPSVLQVLRQTKQVAMDAYASQDLPFEEVVRALNPERSLAHAPVFQVKFVLQNMPSQFPELPGLKLRFIESRTAVSKLDLTVLVSPTPEGLACSWMYSADLFEAATVERMARHFQRLLEAVAAEGGRQRLSDLPLLTDAERHRVLVEWNDTAAPYARRCIHELISEQAARVPDAVAVVAGDECLTYAELERRANQLAHWLKALGVEPETRVGLFVERRAHALVGLLGILKAGGAYVAIDPAYAHMSERVRHVLQDAKVQVIVTEESLANELPSQGEFLVSLDAEDGLLESQPEEPPVSGVLPGNAAYVIYTSGSTGQPKGVCIEHGQLACYVAGVSRRLELPEGMSFASVSTLAADLGHTALFPTLCAGGTVHLVGMAAASDSARLWAYGRKHGVEGLKIVPTHLEALLAADDMGELLPRKRLVLGGDRAEWSLVERVHALAPECEVFNHYGPTETTVGVLAQRVERGERVPGTQSVPLGRPLGNVRVYVLDGYGQPVPPGVPGELYVGGQSVGRGYLGRPDGTAERFVPDRFSGEAGARLYRTGDRVRWLEDGRIEFLGRVDHQLKIRGFRVELGEVEAVLSQHPGVGECVVVAREDVPGDRQLVAYAVGRPGKALEEASLREHLSQRLPDYMVPSACVVLEALPLTANGKVDRKALPAPSRKRGTEYVEPRTPTEQRLAGLWKELLAVPRVGASDDFFELGGHSLLATQVVARVRSLFDVQLAVIDLFEAPTLEALAARIEAGSTTSDSPLVTLRKGGSARPFFCVHPVGGSVLAYLELSKRMDADQPFYGLQVPAGGAGDSVEEMAARYLEAVREVQPEGPYLLGGWSMGGRVAYEMARQLEARGEAVGLLVVIDARGQDAEVRRTEEQEVEVVLEFASHLSRLAAIHPRAAEVLEHVDAVELAALLDG